MNSQYTEGQKLKIRTDYDGCCYITAGRVYDAEVLDEGAIVGVGLQDDEGSDLYCLLDCGCGHINGNQWEVVQ